MRWLVLFLALSGCFGKQYYPYAYAPAALKTDRPRVLLHRAIVRDELEKPPLTSLVALNRALRDRFERAGFVVDGNTAALKKLEAITTMLPQAGARPVAATLAPLGEEGLCDLVVFPIVEARLCEAQGVECRWDGVIRIVPRANDTPLVFGGGLEATSLLVYVYACSGKEVLTSRGGLEPVRYFYSEHVSGNMTASPMIGTGGVELWSSARADYLDDPTVRAEAVALALHPLIEMKGYPANPEPWDPSRLPTEERREAP